MSYFPMFIQLKGRRCLVAGGGRIALRKVQVLKEFGAQITVAAPDILPQIKAMEGVLCLEKNFEPGDLEGAGLVVAASDDAETNHQISLLCRRQKIPVNAVDQIEDCSFIFPAYVKEGEAVAAFSSGGKSPVAAQYLKEQMQEILTPNFGQLTACLGELRTEMRQCTKSEAGRKKIYREILELGLEMDRIPTEIEIKKIVKKYKDD